MLEEITTDFLLVFTKKLICIRHQAPRATPPPLFAILPSISSFFARRTHKRLRSRIMRLLLMIMRLLLMILQNMVMMRVLQT